MKLNAYVATGIGTLVAAAAVTFFVTTAHKPMPEVAYTRLDGSNANTRELKGHVVLVNFWATSCATCVKEMPKLVELHQRFRSQGYETLAVAMKYDPPAYVMNFVASRKLPLTVVMDNLGAMAQGFGHVQMTPTSFLINKRGQVVKTYVGEPDFEALGTLVEKLLVEP
jgi:peroxiredoxin